MKLKYFLPAFTWAIIILLVSLIPGNKIPSISILNLKFADKIIHLGMYLVFAALISFGLYLQKSQGLTRNFFISFTIPFFFASITEIMQYFFIRDRTGDIMDMLANLTGIITGIYIARFFSKTKIFNKYFKSPES